MPANVTLIQNDTGIRAIKYNDETGREERVQITGKRVFAPTKIWHMKDEENVIEGGVPVNEVLNLIDGDRDMETWLQPLATMYNGTRIKTNYSLICAFRNRTKIEFESNGSEKVVADPVIYDVVETGTMSNEDWANMNDNVKYPTRSKLYEVITPSMVMSALEQTLRKDGVTRASGAGFLGDNGERGMWVSIQLPDWDTDVANKVGTPVREYMVIYAPPTGRIFVYNTSVVVVCENTLMWSLNSTERVLKLDHQLGADGRMRYAMQNIWSGALEGRQTIQNVASYLADLRLTDEQAKQVLNDTYAYRGKPDEQFVGVSSLDKRQARYEANIVKTDMTKDAIYQVYRDEQFHDMAGITPEHRNTAWGLMQAITWHKTYEGGRNTNNTIADFLTPGGQKQTTMNNALKSMMKIRA